MRGEARRADDSSGAWVLIAFLTHLLQTPCLAIIKEGVGHGTRGGLGVEGWRGG